MTGPGAATDAAAYRLGLSCMFTATLFTSIAGIVLRLVEEADGWQVLFYRSAALVLTLAPGWVTAPLHAGPTVWA